MTIRLRPLTIRAERVGSDGTSPGHLDAPAFPYHYRDRDRITAERLAELKAHDRHIAELNAGAGEPPPRQDRSGQAGRAQAKRRQFAALRALGYTVAEAAAEVGVTVKTGHRYNRELRRQQGPAS